MSGPIIGYGGTFERSSDGTTYTNVPGVRGLAVPQVTTEYQEVTSLDSPNGFREYIKGMKDAGEVTVPMNYTADGYEQQVADQNAADSIFYRLTMPMQPGQTTADVFTFRAFPTPEVQADDLGAPTQINLNLRLTGDVTWVKGSA